MAGLSTLLGNPKTQASDSIQTDLGLVVYSINHQRRNRAAKSKRDADDPKLHFEIAKDFGASGIQTRLGIRDSAWCENIRSYCQREGMMLEGIVTPPFADDEIPSFRSELETAQRAGARAVRTVIIPGRRYERFSSLEEFRHFESRGRKALERAAPMAESVNVALAVENHKDQRLDERIALFEHIDSHYVGACIDVGNSFALMEDPMEVVRTFAPYGWSVHLKDQAVAVTDGGFLFADVALGDGFLDLPSMVQEIRQAKPDIQFFLESITRDPLLVPCLNPSFWAPFPEIPATDLARTMRSVQANASTSLPQISNLSSSDQLTAEANRIRDSLHHSASVLQL